MNISINGKAKTINDDLHLSQLIEQLELTGKRLAIEVNQEIIPKSEHSEYKIKEDDTIEIVHAIGGG
jgi:sulfur carrier protein